MGTISVGLGNRFFLTHRTLVLSAQICQEKMLRCTKLKYSSQSREKETRRVHQLSERQVKTSGRLLTLLSVHWNCELTSGPCFQDYLKRIANHQILLCPAYTWALQIVAHNQCKSSRYIFLTDYIPITEPFLLHFFLPSLFVANVNYFETIYIFHLPTFLPGWQTCDLLHLVLLLLV